MQIEDSSDTSLPDSPNLHLVDVETGRARSVANSDALAATARSLQRNVAEKIRNNCIAPINISITWSAVSSGKNNTRSAEHRWPALLKAD